MPRIAGVDIPDNKPVWIALRYMYGVGPKLARDIVTELKITDDIRGKDLTEEQLSEIATILDRDFVVEGQLRRQRQESISRLKSIGCYRGLRHRRGLPCRGQRTKTNARTRKGRKKTVAGKKSVKEMR